MKIKRGDWVRTKAESKHVGTVLRMAKDGSWCDVSWPGGWHKRMQTVHLVPVHTITSGDWEITDVTRQRELEAMEIWSFSQAYGVWREHDCLSPSDICTCQFTFRCSECGTTVTTRGEDMPTYSEMGGLCGACEAVKITGKLS